MITRNVATQNSGKVRTRRSRSPLRRALAWAPRSACWSPLRPISEVRTLVWAGNLSKSAMPRSGSTPRESYCTIRHNNPQPQLARVAAPPRWPLQLAAKYKNMSQRLLSTWWQQPACAVRAKTAAEGASRQVSCSVSSQHPVHRLHNAFLVHTKPWEGAQLRKLRGAPHQRNCPPLLLVSGQAAAENPARTRKGVHAGNTE